MSVAVKFFPADYELVLTPAGANPNVAVRTMIPMSAHPDAARMRVIPMSAHPDPASAPFPNAANPDESRVGRDRNDLDLRRRRFARLLHNDDASRLAFDDAASEQRQAGGD